MPVFVVVHANNFIQSDKMEQQLKCRIVIMQKKEECIIAPVLLKDDPISLWTEKKIML